MNTPIADVISIRADQPSEDRPARPSHERVTGAQAVIRTLEELGVDYVFGIPGGAILPV